MIPHFIYYDEQNKNVFSFSHPLKNDRLLGSMFSFFKIYFSSVKYRSREKERESATGVH